MVQKGAALSDKQSSIPAVAGLFFSRKRQWSILSIRNEEAADGRRIYGKAGVILGMTILLAS